MLVISDNKKRTYLTRVAGLHLKILVSIVRYKLDYSSIVTYLPILVSFGEWFWRRGKCVKFTDWNTLQMMRKTLFTLHTLLVI